MLPGYLQREKLRKEVEICVQAGLPHSQLYLFGSSSFMLFSPESDIDLCIFPPPNYISNNLLSTKEFSLKILNKVIEGVQEIFEGSELISNVTVPIIRHFGENFSFDISSSDAAYQKTLLLQRYT